jgi:hypothetical protein
MVETRELAARFEAYGDWRRRLSAAVASFAEWLATHDLDEARIAQRIAHIQAGLASDKLTVAFVAEFSRGKSELINAIFFADFGARLLPSAAGRTTMCPTELQYDEALPPSIRLLPIETRLNQVSVGELKQYAEEWVALPLDLSSPAQMTEALQRVCDVLDVPADVAARYGLHERTQATAEDDGAETALVTIPRWRHAIINFPHPLLTEGLVVLDTPGLNAIGIEPDLTLNQLPDAHAVLFILAADAGATRTDLDVWNRYLAVDHGDTSRIVVLNKIDGLWDELKTGSAIDAEIERQIADSARLLGVRREQVFAVSAQKALAAKVNGDDALLVRSRLPALEAALTGSLVPARRDIVGHAVLADMRALATDVRTLLDARAAALAREVDELAGLRGKNQDVVDHMMERVRNERTAFERGLARFTALRTVLSDHANRLYDHISHDSLRRTATRTRDEIEAAPFTKGIRAAMAAFFASVRADFDAAAAEVSEIHEMMQAMYARFAAERSLERFAPPPFSMFKYQKELERLERAYNTQFNTLWNMLSSAKFGLTQRFFVTIAARAKHVYDIANRDAESWVHAVMAPLESQVREQGVELRRRLESLKRINDASGELESRVAELEQSKEALRAEIAALDDAVDAIEVVVRQPELVPLAANG